MANGPKPFQRKLFLEPGKEPALALCDFLQHREDGCVRNLEQGCATVMARYEGFSELFRKYAGRMILSAVTAIGAGAAAYRVIKDPEGDTAKGVALAAGSLAATFYAARSGKKVLSYQTEIKECLTQRDFLTNQQRLHGHARSVLQEYSSRYQQQFLQPANDRQVS